MARFRFLSTITLALAAGAVGCVHAFTVDINPRNPRTLYLRVGDGAFSANSYRTGGDPGDLATVNRVALAVPAASVGNGIPLAMAANATQLVSNYDNFVFCNAGQVYVGGFYRRNGNNDSAALSVTAPGVLTSAAGDTVPFSQISWSSSGNGDTGAQPVPAGTFTGGSQALATFPVNTWRESCLTFRYANASVVPGGTYVGQVTYTLAAP